MKEGDLVLLKDKKGKKYLITLKKGGSFCISQRESFSR
jgi:tRNA A58 N-methylase Trm61